MSECLVLKSLLEIIKQAMNVLLDEDANLLLEGPQLACNFVIPVIEVCNDARYANLQEYLCSDLLR